MRRFAQAASSHKFLAEVSLVTVGTAGSQIVLLAVSPLLSRLYTPAEFGGFSVFFSVASIVAVIASLRLDAVIPMVSRHEGARTVARWGLVASVGIAAVVSATVVAIDRVSGQRLTMLGSTAYEFAFLVALSWLLSAWALLRALQSRLGNFVRIGRSTFTSSVTQAASQVILGLLGLASSGLILGFGVSRLTNCVALARGAGLWSGPTVARGKWRFRFWMRYPLLLVPPSVLNLLTVSAVAPLIATLFGVTFAGLFTFAARMLTWPAALIGQSVATVFFPRAAAMERAGRSSGPFLHDTMTALALLGLPVFGLVFGLGPEIFSIVFGPDWREAGVVAALLSPWLAASLVSSPVSGLATVKNELGKLFALSVIEAILRVAALGLGRSAGGALLATAAYSMAGVAISLFFIGWSLHLCGSSYREWPLMRDGRFWAVLMAFGATPVARLVLPAPMAVVLVIGATLGALALAVVEGTGHLRAERDSGIKS